MHSILILTMLLLMGHSLELQLPTESVYPTSYGTPYFFDVYQHPLLALLHVTPRILSRISYSTGQPRSRRHAVASGQDDRTSHYSKFTLDSWKPIAVAVSKTRSQNSKLGRSGEPKDDRPCEASAEPYFHFSNGAGFASSGYPHSGLGIGYLQLVRRSAAGNFEKGIPDEGPFVFGRRRIIKRSPTFHLSLLLADLFGLGHVHHYHHHHYHHYHPDKLPPVSSKTQSSLPIPTNPVNSAAYLSSLKPLSSHYEHHDPQEIHHHHHLHNQVHPANAPLVGGLKVPCSHHSRTY